MTGAHGRPTGDGSTEARERDAMQCRACGQEERASEGYPCAGCGTFICLICTLRGVTECAGCAAAARGGDAPPQRSDATPAPDGAIPEPDDAVPEPDDAIPEPSDGAARAEPSGADRPR